MAMGDLESQDNHLIQKVGGLGQGIIVGDHASQLTHDVRLRGIFNRGAMFKSSLISSISQKISLDIISMIRQDEEHPVNL